VNKDECSYNSRLDAPGQMMVRHASQFYHDTKCRLSICQTPSKGFRAGVRLMPLDTRRSRNEPPKI
jgi:hypothetical protein